MRVWPTGTSKPNKSYESLKSDNFNTTGPNSTL